MLCGGLVQCLEEGVWAYELLRCQEESDLRVQGDVLWALSPKFSASLGRRTVVHVFMLRWKGDSDLWM